MFQNYRNVLAYILNQTKSIDGMILDEVENLIGYAEEPDDHLRTVGDYLIKSLYNEPQIPYFDEFGAEFYELSCQEIEQELKILFEVSKYFVIKAVRNEETIKMLKTLVSDLAKVGYDNYDFISNVIDTIADNYAAQNHVFMMIENLDEEIQMEIETIAKYCRKEDYKVIEVVEETEEDSLLDILMDNGQDLLELIGIKADEDSELEEAPELLFFEGFAEPEGNLKVSPEEAAIEEQEHPQFHLFGEFEEAEDPNLNKTDEISGPIVINLVLEPENPQNENNLSESHAKNTETEEILDFLVENPEIVDLLLQKLEPEETDEKSNLAEDVEIEKLAKDDPEVENIVFSKFKDEKVMTKNIDDEYLDAVKTENIETENLKPKNSNLEKINPENINVKGMIIKIPYPDEDINKNAPKSEEEMDSKKLENPGIVPEAGNFKIIFPIKNEDKIDQGEGTDNEDLENELIKMNFKNGEDLKFIDQELENDSKFDELIQDLKLENQEFEKELDESELDEDIKSNKQSNYQNNKIEDKLIEKILKATENDMNEKYSDDKNSAQVQNKEELEDTKEFVDFDAENLNNETEDKNSNFEKFLKVPESFWQIPLGFWQNFQNFWGGGSNSSDSTKNLGILDEISNQNSTDLSKKLRVEDRNSKDNTKDSDNLSKNSKDSDETQLNLDTNKKKNSKGANKEDPENDENSRIYDQKDHQNNDDDFIILEDNVDTNDGKLTILNENENADKENSEKSIKKLNNEGQDIVRDFPEDEATKELDDEILISELLNGEILTGNNEIFQPELDDFETENQDEQIIKEQFGFEEGIGGIDDEIVSKIKKNKKESKSATNNDRENSKNDQKFKIDLKNPKGPKTDSNSELGTKNDETQENDGKPQESELKEDDFIPQFSENDSDVEKVKIIDDESNFEELGKEILKLFGISENDNKEIEEFEENFNNEEDLNKSEGSIKIKDLTNKQEMDNLEQERQLMLELEDGKNSTKIDNFFENDEQLNEIEKNDEFEEGKVLNEEDFEGEIFDDVIDNKEENSLKINKIPEIDSQNIKEALENPKKLDNKKYKNERKQEIESSNKIKNKLEKFENDMKEAKEQEIEELMKLMK